MSVAHEARAASIAAATTLGTVSLTVSDPERARAFYERVVGLRATVAHRDDGELELAAPGSSPLVRLSADPSAPALDRRATGLYHLAMLVATRHDLGHALRRLATARWPLDGASDHLVSEALYLSDPDGNGVEIYWDRPREQWTRVDGALQMATLPLDLHSILAEGHADSEPQATVPTGTRIGHVHLQVADLREAEAFYHGVLGFDVMVRGYPGALFVSAGGYHHHIGLNTWHSAGSGPARPGSIGLRSYEVLLPGEDRLAATLERVRAAGLPLGEATSGGAATVRDPSGNVVVLRSGA